MTALIERMEQLRREGKPTPPAFAFIDPFGPNDMPFDLIRRFMSFPRTEVFVNMMVGSGNRWVEHEHMGPQIEATFGLPVIENLPKDAATRTKAMTRLYEQQLQTVAKHVRYFEMRNRKGEIIYDLFFATNHPLGFVKMKDSMWRTDPTGEFGFSDATDPTLPVLFNLEPDVPKLADKVHAAFVEQGSVSGKVVKEFVENQTGFLNPHKTKALTALEGSGRLAVAAMKSNGKPRKAGSYPDDAILSFS